MHHPLSVFNPFNEVMQISQDGVCVVTQIVFLVLLSLGISATKLLSEQVFTNDTFIQLLAPGEFRQAFPTTSCSI